MYKLTKEVILALLLLPLLLSSSCRMSQKEGKKILLIHSFEEGRGNYAIFNKELITALNKLDIRPEIHAFYLDCERYADKEERDRIYNFIDTIQHINPDIILVNDDQATYSLLASGHPFVKTVPVIFAGVNYPNWNLINKFTNVTGLYDKQDFVKNIEFINTLFGQLKIRIAYDRTALGKISFIEVLRQLRPHKNIEILRPWDKLQYEGFINQHEKEAIQILQDSTRNASMPGTPPKPGDLGQVIFTPFRLLSNASLLANLAGINDRTTYLDVKYDHTSEAMCLLTRYPSFSAHNEPIQYNTSLKNRYIGGYMTSFETQAKEQAQMAAEILKGKSVNQLPIKESAKEYLLIWESAKTWGLPLKQIPPYVRIIGIPFYERHATAMNWLLAIAFITVVIIAISLGKMYMREEKYKRKAQEDLIKQNKILEIALEKAKESDHMKSAFLANMSHEIRTPLNAIVGFSNLLNSADRETELEKEERTQFLDLINTNSELLLNLINDILDLSRIESGRMSFVFIDQDLTELIKDIYGTYQMMMPAGVELLIETPEKPVSIYTDKHRLMQVITNFLNNAIKFTQRGYIKVGYSYNPEEQLVSIFVEDTGVGIAKEKQAAVFDRFTKLDEFAKGTGLGLSICKVISERFSGTISVSSEKGKGSRFYVTLPLRPKDQ